MPGRVMVRPIDPIDETNVSEVLSMSTPRKWTSKVGMNTMSSIQWARYGASPVYDTRRRMGAGTKILPVIGGAGRGTSQTEQRRTA